jgi:PKD repeat protein
VFEFKKLSIREIVGSEEVAEGALLEEGGAAAEEEEEEGGAAAEEEEEEGGAAAEEEEEEGGAAAEEESLLQQQTTTDHPTVEILSNGMEGEAPATFEFGAHITGGTEPYTISWDFGDGSEGSDEETVEHTFEEPGTYNVVVTITDSNDQTASDSLEITVEEAAIEQSEGEQEAEE